ncbi:MAG: homoserine dehydrogenase [Streptosporangiales bacterium]|nr:homoserine dehydrogenase [Streptosporangiales bacterium]
MRVALLGCGVVGSALVGLIKEQSADLAARVGAPLELAGVAVRRPARARDVDLDPGLLTSDAEALVRRDDVDVVVEVIGGIEPARGLILAAFASGKSVVTANKALLASHGAELHEAARAAGVDLYYEASVAGGIPLLRPLRESLVGDTVHRVLGIVNGTTNYILTRMAETGATFGDALDEATALGYAEADPTADVDGYDAAAKAAILAELAFHSQVTAADVYREGISEVSASDVASAREMGCVVKLLAIAERAGGDSIDVRVHPAMIPETHPLASVREAYNAVFVECSAAGQLMFYGQGAGGAPTASAVLGDVVAVARNARSGRSTWASTPYAQLRARPMGEVATRYHLSLDVLDKTGVLAEVAQVFAAKEVSLQTVRQEGHGDDAQLVVVTHVATDAALAATVEELRRLAVVREVASVMRVEGL